MSDETTVDAIDLKITGDESSLDQAISNSLGLLQRFASGVDSLKKRIDGGLSQAFGGTGQDALAFAGAADRAGASVRKTGEESGRGAASVSRLALEFKAGRLSADQYESALEKLAAEAKDGSNVQLAALARLRTEREKSARTAEQTASREAAAAARVVRATRQAARETEQAAKRPLPSPAVPIRPGILGHASVSAPTGVDDEIRRSIQAISHLEEEFNQGRMSAAQFQAALGKVAREAKEGSDVQVAALSRLRTELDRTAEADGRSVMAVTRLSREYRAGVLPLDQYRAKLRDVADASEQGSNRQMAALARLRQAEQEEAREAKRLADEKVKDAKRVADAKEKESQLRADRSDKKWRAADTIGDGIQGTGNFLTRAVSAPLVAGAAYAVKVTLDYDQAFNDVKKFTAGTKLQLGTLQKDLRALSREKIVGSDFEDLSHIAAFGSQLGIERKNLKEFTRDVAYLGKAGDMSGEMAATGLAKISSAMALPQGKIKNMASSLAAMGNLGSSTLDEILQVSQRFASSAGLAKLDPSAVFAYANAVTSLGQQAEAGGSSLMKTFEKVDSSVNQGGEALKLYANVAGMTSAQFVKAYREDAAGAVQQFFAGLSKQSKVAGEADRILTALGITEVREKQAVLNLANGHNLLAGALKESSRAYAAGDEHQKKAAIAAESYKSQLAEARREVKDAAFELGQSLVPTLIAVMKATKPVIEDARHLAEAFGRLSPEAQQAWLKVGLGVVIMGPLLAGLGSLVGWVVRVREAFAILKAANTAEELLAISRATTTLTTTTGQLVPGIATAGATANVAAGKFNLFKMSVMGLTRAFGYLALAALAFTQITWDGDSVVSMFQKMREAQGEAAQAHEDFKNNPLRESVTKQNMGRSDAQSLKNWRKQHPDLSRISWHNDVPNDIREIFLRRGTAVTGDDGTIMPKRYGFLGRDFNMTRDYRAALGSADGDFVQGKKDLTAVNRKRAQADAEAAANGAENEFAKNIARAASSIDFGGKNLNSACALFVTTTLKKAGADFKGSNVARDLRDQLLGAGGVAKPIKDAKPGDVIFLEGPGFGTIKDKKGNGVHTGIAMGNGMIRDEGSKGVRTRSVASVLAGQKGAQAYAVSVPESLSVPENIRKLNGADGPTGTVPYDPNLFAPKPKKPKAAPTFLSAVPMESLEGLTGGNLDSAPTGAGNYEAKLAALESLLAQKQLGLQQEAKKSGQSFDEFGFQVQSLAQKLLLADNALRNTGAEISRLTPKIAEDEAAYKASNKALNDQITLINGKRRAGKPVTTDDNALLTRLRNDYRTAQKVYADDKKALGENLQVNRSAIQQKIQDMNALAQAERTHLSERRAKFLAEQKMALASGSITRGQYEQNLKEAVGRVGDNSPDAPAFKEALTDSATTRTNAGKDLRKKTLLIDKKDFDAQREELDDEIAAYRAAGVAETEIVAYEAKRRAEIRHAEFEKTHDEQRTANRANYESGMQSLAGYRAYLVSLLSEVQAEYGQTSAEAAKLNLEIMKLGWDEVSQGADQYREALSQGDISIQEYVVALEALRGTLPTVSNEYRRMSRDIDGANRKMVQDARRSADEMGRAFGDATVHILRRSKSVGQVAKETLDTAVDGWIKETVGKVVSRVVLKNKLQDNAKQLKEAAEAQAAQLQKIAADTQMAAANKQVAGAAAMGQQVDRLTGVANQMAGAVGPGGTVKGSSTTTTTAEKAVGIANQAAGASGNKKVQDALGKTSTAISVAKDASSGNIAGAAGAAATVGWLGKAAAKAMPWVGVGMAALSLLGGTNLFRSQYLGFNTKEGGSVFQQVGKGDHSGLIDSGLSGPEGLRQLAARSEAQKAQMSAPKTKVWAPQLASGAIQINTLPGQSSEEIADAVIKKLGEKAAMENSGMGNF